MARDTFSSSKKTYLSWDNNNFIDLFFCEKKYLLVGAWGMLWAGESVSVSVDQ